jgi:hypothetical protein
MKKYKNIIQMAELEAMTPGAVVELLKRDLTQTDVAADYDTIDEDTERALLNRADPLITLSLASHGRHIEIVSEIFHAADAGSPIRLACLSNKCVSYGHLGWFPEQLFNGETEAMVRWISEASSKELGALFDNPTLSDSFLQAVLERRNEWEAITDDRLRIIVLALADNQRMRTRTPREGNVMEGLAYFSYHSVFDAAWNLAKTAPVNELWAFALGCLFEQLPSGVSIKEPLRLAERWHLDSGDPKANKQQGDDHETGYLRDMEIVRKALAKKALETSHELLGELLASNDRALRAAVYASGRITAEQLLDGFKKDGEIVFDEAITNTWLWMHEDTRQALQHIAWNNKNGTLFDVNVYNDKKKETQEKHPKWFVHEEDAGESSATKNDIATLAARLDRESQNVEEIRQTLCASKDAIDFLAKELARPIQSIEEIKRTQCATKDAIDFLAKELARPIQSVEEIKRTLYALMSRDDNVGNQLSATRHDISFLMTSLNRQCQSIDEMQQTLRTLRSQTKWFWWLLLLVLVVSLWHF